ncbi:hypothetical protein GC1_00028 [Gluconobacter phage GC1]|uniref:Uncharacterized protein n=1 Tax=Gluconobacter phage GC1 TaxID=2047788 RepID=A0A2I5AR83_9VIRU|nr:hypothetical protein FDJ08_gp28 [Gluconobacter phage GC1]ATS92596.1 hypothetical protein GC1_00028 [Gluconobacter phage GC1]
MKFEATIGNVTFSSEMYATKEATHEEIYSAYLNWVTLHKEDFLAGMKIDAELNDA